jgi:radical SAM superfamily enzyme YgiQ (UPF0313 family)
MKILFINRLMAGECIGRVPLGILYLSSALRHAGHVVELADASQENHLRNRIETFRPNVLAYSVRTGYHKQYTRLNRKIKQGFPDILSIFGGNHPTFFPQMILKEPAIDAVCIGEAEEALVDFLDRLQSGTDYQLTQNFWVRYGGKIFKNPPRRLIEPVDKIHFPDRDLLNGWPRIRDFPVRNFITTRGCPYQCTYCFNYAYFNKIYKGLGKRVRRRTLENVMAEIEEEYLRYPFQVAQFEDDIFVFDKNWISEFSKQYSRRIGVPFTCNVRPEIIDEEKAAFLKKAGCVSVWVGVEAGDETIRKDMLRRRSNNNAIMRGVHALQNAGIRVATENILGVPKTTLNHDFKTLEFNQLLRPSFANPSLFQPYPQTPLGDLAQKVGAFSGDYDDIPDFYEGSCLKINHLKQVQNLKYLFSIAVEYPWLTRLIRILVRFPLAPLYKKVELLWKGYILTHRIAPMRMSIRHYLHVLRRALTVRESVEF